MKENDFDFINEVADFYLTTIETTHPQGNMSAVAEQFGITRAKVNKILITAGVLDTPLCREIRNRKEAGYDVKEIASALGVSVTTVKINMPYEKVIYNGVEKSAGAGYIEKFREREKLFMNGMAGKATEYEGHRQMQEDSARELSPDWMVLHIELDADLSEVRKLAKIKYGNTISRDILVPADMPLHNLHYVIIQLFGFLNYHLHNFKLSEQDLYWVTKGKVENWKYLIGLVFANPIRDEEMDFWDDDYKGGSLKKYMRSKYTGPHYKKIYEESYPYIREMVDSMPVRSKNLEDLLGEFENHPFHVNETIPVGQIFSAKGSATYRSIEEYYNCIEKSILAAANFLGEDVRTQPCVSPFAGSLTYEYDYGDGWSFTITPHEDAEYLVKQGRITTEEFHNSVQNIVATARPVVLAVDGLPLVEDVGGEDGYIDFLQGINGLPSDNNDDIDESLTWAKSLGWKTKVNKHTIL